MSAQGREPSPDCEGICRRGVLGGIAGVLGFGLLESFCAPEEPVRPNQVSVELRDLPPGRRMIVAIAGNPIEVMRTGEGVRALLLRCTHTGCAVKWKPELAQYVCPCHDGRYDTDGNVVSGPPPAPLRRVPVSISGGRAIVGSGAV